MKLTFLVALRAELRSTTKKWVIIFFLYNNKTEYFFYDLT